MTFKLLIIDLLFWPAKQGWQCWLQCLPHQVLVDIRMSWEPEKATTALESTAWFFGSSLKFMDQKSLGQGFCILRIQAGDSSDRLWVFCKNYKEQVLIFFFPPAWTIDECSSFLLRLSFSSLFFPQVKSWSKHTFSPFSFEWRFSDSVIQIHWFKDKCFPQDIMCWKGSSFLLLYQDKYREVFL